MTLKVIGGGLAGCEAAWQAAERGIDVELYEMRPERSTGVHQTSDLAELVCSNSLGSNLPNRASGVLKNELRRMGSLLIACADANSLPAGGALAVDREEFSRCVQEKITGHPKIKVIRKEVAALPDPPAIIATGPLTSPALSAALTGFTGEDQLYFYDAVAPIINYDSINMEVAFRANRYNKGILEEGDYINCPFDMEAYYKFRDALLNADRLSLKDFEVAINEGVDAGKGYFFQGCQPIEIIAGQGEKSLAFGPMRPVGLTDPKTDRWPYAVVQLRQDNLAGDLYNLVGFQTNLTYSEQARVFRMIPGLEKATFARFGQMHRNTFIASPNLLDDTLEFRSQPGLFAVGQLTGIEGYAGNIASGLIAGINAAHSITGRDMLILPVTTMTGAMIYYISHAALEDFQPMKAMFGLLPQPSDGQQRTKRERYAYYGQRALEDLESYLENSHS